MRKNEKGFTLIEGVISLLIVAIIALPSFNFIVRTYDYFQLTRFLSTFQANLHRVRDFNMIPPNQGDRLALRIHHLEDRYDILLNQQVIESHTFPQNVTMPHRLGVTNLSFNESGNLGAGMTLQVLSRYHQRHVVFSVGMGGFDVRQWRRLRTFGKLSRTYYFKHYQFFITSCVTCPIRNQQNPRCATANLSYAI